MVLLDANVLIYYLDETADSHVATVDILQELVNDQEQLATSHHIIEEVLFIFSKIVPDISLIDVVKKISELPNLILVEPSPSIDFAKRYAELSQKLHAGINDALILQLLLDAGIMKIFSYDKKLLKQAQSLSIEQVNNLK
jgi:predicted nucleic acid-binding protein